MTTGAKSKQEFQERSKQMEKDFKKKKINPNHIVTPNLTPRGRDILMRLKSKSLDTTGERSYTLNEDIVNSRFMSKHELIQASKRNNEKIDQLKNQLTNTITKNETNKQFKQQDQSTTKSFGTNND